MATTTRKRTTAKTAVPAVKTEPEAAEPVKPIPKEIDVHQYIPVRNGFNGILIYRSSKTGEVFRWDGFGDEQDMELLELRNAKNTGKTFFINNWFFSKNFTVFKRLFFFAWICFKDSSCWFFDF